MGKFKESLYVDWCNKHDVRISEFDTDTLHSQSKFEIKLYIRYRDEHERIMYLMQFRDEDQYLEVVKIPLIHLTPGMVKELCLASGTRVNSVLLPLTYSKNRVVHNGSNTAILYNGNRTIVCDDIGEISVELGCHYYLVNGLFMNVFKSIAGWQLYLASTSRRDNLKKRTATHYSLATLSKWYGKLRKYSNIVKLNKGYWWDHDHKLIVTKKPPKRKPEKHPDLRKLENRIALGLQPIKKSRSKPGPYLTKALKEQGYIKQNNKLIKKGK